MVLWYTLILAGLCAGIPVLCSFSPEFAAFWNTFFPELYADTVSSVSAVFPFPVLEVLVPAAAFCCAACLCTALLKRSRSALCGLAQLFLIPFCIYLLTWLPAYPSGTPEEFPLSADRAEALCRRLISGLNSSSLAFPEPALSLRLAEDAVSAFAGIPLPSGSVKTARYPEWMDASGIAGFYSPWTAEAIVHPGLSEAALPFTACHELAHRLGIADEGQANIAAWQACRQAGGALADSADLWALRYAMAALRNLRPAAWQSCSASMSPRLEEIFRSMHGFSDPSSPSGKSIAVFAAPRRSASNYDALAGWLAMHLSEN